MRDVHSDKENEKENGNNGDVVSQNVENPMDSKNDKWKSAGAGKSAARDGSYDQSSDAEILGTCFTRRWAGERCLAEKSLRSKIERKVKSEIHGQPVERYHGDEWHNRVVSGWPETEEGDIS